MNYIQSIKSNKHRFCEIFNLLNQLTDAPQLNQYHFENIIYSLKTNHHIYLYIKDDKVVGMITILIEQKLIHGGKCVGHIEDLVVDEKYKGQGIAKELLAYTIQIAKDKNCYKVILDCKEELIPFYEKNGFISKGDKSLRFSLTNPTKGVPLTGVRKGLSPLLYE
jgi:glucosamine-phosphate N-acetyltransferase